MIGCDSRPGCPLDRTVRGDRRPRDRFGPAPGWPAETADRCRAGVPGRGAGPARGPVGASLAADVLRPAGAPVPLPAQTARLPQAAQGCGTAAGRGDRSPGPPVAVLARPGAADRCHPGAVRRLPGDRQAVRAGRVGALRVLRGAFALVLGLKLYLITAPDGTPAAWCLADPKLSEREVAADLLAPCGPRRVAAPRADPHWRQGLGRLGVRGPGHHRVPHAPG